MLNEYIKKYKIPKNRISQVRELFKITGDPKLATYIVNATKAEPHLVDYLIQNYKTRAKKAGFRDPGAIIYTMFRTIKLDYIIQKKERGAEIPREQLEQFIDCGAAKIITLTNGEGYSLVFEVVKGNKDNVKIIYKDTIQPKDKDK